MAFKTKTDEIHIDNLINKIKQGKTVLFLGAGASINSKVPITSELTESLKIHFPNAKKSDDFNEMCENICFTQGYGRKEVYNFIQSQMINQTPSNSHLILTHYDWGAIFTTNYDDLIEKAYTSNKSLKPLKTITNYYDFYNILDRGICHLFKLNGCARREAESKGSMYLTKTELIGAIDEQNKFYEFLLDVLKDGTMFFIGYSFRDLLYLNIVQKASKKFGIENLTYSYALFPHPENMNEVEINRLKEYRIIPIAMDFNSFFQLIDSKFDHRKLNYNYFKDKTIKTLKSTIIVPYREAESYLSQFNFLFEELINDEPSTKEDFFKGKDLTWGPFNKHWDFERFWYSNEKNFNLKFKVELLLKNYNDEIFNKILLITGIPGIGKTIIAKRLAYDIYKEGYPVAYLDKNPRDFDLRSITKFVMFLNEENHKTSNYQLLDDIPVLILVDNFVDWINPIIALKRNFEYEQIKILIIGFERIGIWSNERKKSTKDLSIDIMEYDTISKNFDLDEKTSLINHLKKIDIVFSKESDLNQVELEEETFFGVMYSLVDPAKEKFNQIIRNQFINLGTKASETFEIICFINQYNLSINHEFLSRILGNLSFSELNEDIIKGEASGLINIEEDNDANIFYRTNHKIIAQRTIEFFFADPEKKTENFIKIFNNVRQNIKFEEQICETIIIDYISKNRGELKNEFTFIQIDRMFESLCNRIESSTLYHHWALIKKDLREFDLSDSFFKKSLELRKLDTDRGKNPEPISYILTSWGILNAERGYEEHSKNNFTKSELYFKHAEARFEEAKRYSITDAVTYHAEAYMNLRRAKLTPEFSKKLEYYKISLELIDKAMINIDQSELILFEKLKIELSTILDQIDIFKTEALAENLYNNFKVIDGYYILIRSILNRLRKISDNDERQILIEKSNVLLKKIIEKEPNNSLLIKLKINMTKEFYPEELLNFRNYIELLKCYYLNEKYPQIDLLFEYGCLNFKLGYYHDSKQVFNKIREILQKSQYKARIKFFDTDDENYLGQVLEINNSRTGQIQSTEPQINFPIFFKPFKSKHYLKIGDLIEFSIQFSIYGPECINIKKR